jgi:hypothetical protein
MHRKKQDIWYNDNQEKVKRLNWVLANNYIDKWSVELLSNSRIS